MQFGGKLLRTVPRTCPAAPLNPPGASPQREVEWPNRVMVAERITIESGKRSGQPCIRRLRITVWDVLGWLAAGRSEEQILDDYPELGKDDFKAVYDYAARLGRRVAL